MESRFAYPRNSTAVAAAAAVGDDGGHVINSQPASQPTSSPSSSSSLSARLGQGNLCCRLLVS